MHKNIVRAISITFIQAIEVKVNANSDIEHIELPVVKRYNKVTENNVVRCVRESLKLDKSVTLLIKNYWTEKEYREMSVEKFIEMSTKIENEFTD